MVTTRSHRRDHRRRPVAAQVVTFRGETAMRLSAGDYTAVFLPHLGMLGASLRWRGHEYLSLHGGLDAFRDGHTTGMPLLAPWANRLGRDRLRVGRSAIDLTGSPAVHRDGNGLAIHGTMVGAHPWHLEAAEADDRRAACVATFAYDASHPHLYDAFPFPHRLEVEVSLDEDGLAVRTAVQPASRRAVPVSFGWHPYYRVAGCARAGLSVGLPARHVLELDAAQLPTGVERRAGAEVVPLAGRALDHGYRLGRDRTFRLMGEGVTLTTTFDRGFGFGQVYAPLGKAFVAIEPMTAPTNALVAGAHPTAVAGEEYAASFTVRVD